MAGRSADVTSLWSSYSSVVANVLPGIPLVRDILVTNQEYLLAVE